ncbi:thioredoxin domain-containing protein [Candidatus Kaiserbacteria bacterium]|nr:thioredoxin domain-containing protein [Candidatus Kaiserbacteria bacterium]
MLQRNFKKIILVVFLGALVGLVVFRASDSFSSFAQPPFIHAKVLLNPPESIYTVPEVTEADHIWGSKDAQVKVIEYSDTECPFCKKNYSNMKYLINYYDGDVAWIYRHHTLDHRFTKSRKEAEASECAASIGGEGAFWLFLDNIYRVTGSNDSLDLSTLPSIVGQFGVDEEAFNTCVEGGYYAGLVEGQNREAFAAEITYTPSMVIIWPDGERRSLIIGARNKKTIKTALDYILGREVVVDTVVEEPGSNRASDYSE